MKVFKNVHEYITKADKAHQATLKRVRKIVRETVPEATEEIAYGMPAYKWQGKPLFYFAAMKGHLGLYPTQGPIQECKELLKNFSTSKGCIRVPYTTEISKTLLVKLLKVRIKQIKYEISRD